MAEVVSVNISEKRGTIKTPIARARLKINHGIEGDSHAENWRRQISLLAQESIDKMSAMGVPDLTPGKFAENITTRGIELYSLPVGTRLMLGECEVEVTQIGKECHRHCEIFKEVGKCVMPSEGVFVKVITEGTVAPGDSVSVLR
ncbi:MAG: MOSC domain-containing protein [Treponemataceae bacterium]|nr:MAG: MOSC domain-containing protein [Treponemataceae bacterium]